MSSRRSVRCVAKSSVPTAPSAGVRACGCAHRFVPTVPQHSHSAPVLARRRSRSSTGSSSKSPGSISSGRNTPSPVSEENEKSEHQPIYFTTSVLIRLSPNKQHFLEQVKYEMRYGQPPVQDDPNLSSHSQHFKTELEIQVDNQSPVETSSNQT